MYNNKKDRLIHVTSTLNGSILKDPIFGGLNMEDDFRFKNFENGLTRMDSNYTLDKMIKSILDE